MLGRSLQPAYSSQVIIVFSYKSDYYTKSEVIFNFRLSQSINYRYAGFSFFNNFFSRF